MKFRLGLTGSIGMGKSTTAKLFAESGCAIWDADAAVHRLYARDGAAVAPLASLFPEAVNDGAVSRDALRNIIQQSPKALSLVESIVHPLVRADREDFSRQNADRIGVFDIPLLFETGGETEMDAVACVTIAEDVQRARVLARGTMTEDQFEAILARQMPIAEKRAKAAYIIKTDTVDHARTQVLDVVKDIERRLTHA